MRIFGFNITRKKIQASGTNVEGGRDVTSQNVTNSTSAGEVVDKNNYKSYQKQVTQTYKMYNGETDYGSELVRGLIDMRTALIAGEGLTIYSPKKKTQDYIDKFVEKNKLNGSLLTQLMQIGEMEGKCLINLDLNRKDGFVEISPIAYYLTAYTVEASKKNINKVEKIEVKKNYLNLNKCVFVKLGGAPGCMQNTYTRIGAVLTDIENYSRTKYDLRKNNHLYARITPYFETQDESKAKSINNAISSHDWKIGTGFAGTAKFYLVSPTTGALESIKGEMLLYIKNISTTYGIPVHWLSWPELMSNRATAENLLEVTTASTQRERQAWEEAFTELVLKSMDMAIDAGFETNDIKGDFTIKIPTSTLAQLNYLIGTWLPLQQADVISMATLRGMIPNINDRDEEKQIEKENKASGISFENTIRSNNDTGTNGQTDDGINGDDTSDTEQEEPDDN